ncbi:hypothetical protein BX661DRAFT_89916 [Kickxella alabastrina]|uniref:uncharacterized protein n=1 Tax=Kickxella alabastrina TaxID=61397 RepID=UPI00221FD15B|nr:uncharacterized protein BX661DRAFT_89916 [Kickxella alabastrina]KAI7830867.1 hypothetical protein BX661DRAFT_89916 [Kickxella alabastrina]
MLTLLPPPVASPLEPPVVANGLRLTCPNDWNVLDVDSAAGLRSTSDDPPAAISPLAPPIPEEAASPGVPIANGDDAPPIAELVPPKGLLDAADPMARLANGSILLLLRAISASFELGSFGFTPNGSVLAPCRRQTRCQRPLRRRRTRLCPARCLPPAGRRVGGVGASNAPCSAEHACAVERIAGCARAVEHVAGRACACIVEHAPSCANACAPHAHAQAGGRQRGLRHKLVCAAAKLVPTAAKLARAAAEAAVAVGVVHAPMPPMPFMPLIDNELSLAPRPNGSNAALLAPTPANCAFPRAPICTFPSCCCCWEKLVLLIIAELFAAAVFPNESPNPPSKSTSSAFPPLFSCTALASFALSSIARLSSASSS